MIFSLTTSPLVFFSLLIYFLTMIFSLSFDSIESVWVMIEVSTFIFVGVTLVISQSASSGMSLISYFLTQSVFSLVLLCLGFCMRFDPNLLVYTLLGFIIAFKLGSFPVHNWYFSAVIYLPNPSFVMSLTLQNVLPLYILTITTPLSSFNSLTHTLFTLMIISILITSILSVSSLDLRSVVVFTSVANNIWLLSSSVVSLSTFLVFLFVYSILIVALLLPFPFSNVLSLVSLSGLPPFPMFFLNLFVVYGLSGHILFLDFYLYIVSLILGTLIVSLSYIRLVVSNVIVIPI